MNRLPLGAATALVATALAALATAPDPAAGCAVAPPPDEYVSTADETALVVWDAKTKTEHFVRRASFRSSAYDFGFLVPTPTRPHLDVADDDLFEELSTLTAAKVEYREVVRETEKDLVPEFGCLPRAAMMGERSGDAPLPAAGRPGAVAVLEQKKVGDYDATVLTFRRGTNDTPAGGAAELTKWLAKHGYEASPEIKTWLERYVKDEWCVTAFKVGAKKADDPHGVKADPGRGGGRPRDLRAPPIRMSFKADRPFYPYREPEAGPAKPPQSRNESRLLRVFVAAPARYAGALGDGSKPWPGQTVWADSTDAARWGGVFQKAKLTAAVNEPGLSLAAPKADAGWWLTEFEDRSSPRPGTDEVYFAPSADASSMTRPPVIVTNTRTIVRTPWWHVVVYIGVPAALIIGPLAAWRMLRRRPKAPASDSGRADAGF